MTPEQHAKAIEDAALLYGAACHLHAQDADVNALTKALEAKRELIATIRAGVGAQEDAPDLVAELEEVKTVCAQAYQVVGILLSDAGRFDSPEAEKILDNLAEQRLKHTDVLPWESKAAPEWLPISTAPKDGTFVIVYPPSFSGVASCARWDSEPHSKKPRPIWRRVDVPGKVWSRNTQPTHWMPLPPAPKP